MRACYTDKAMSIRPVMRRMARCANMRHACGRDGYKAASIRPKVKKLY